jgi:DNA-binding NarL/FixJ family response regulator
MSAPGATSPADAAEGKGLPASRTHTVVVYSNDAAVRDRVRTAVGRSPAPDLGRIEWVECASGPQVLGRCAMGGVDVCILDGEAWPTGGMGLAKQMKDELRDCPHTLVLIARRDDAWLATWSLADGVVSHPVDPGVLTGTVAELLRARESAAPVRRAVPLGR